MMVRRIWAALLLSAALTASSKTKLLEHIPLEWRPTSELRLGTIQMTASTVAIAPFTDARDNKELIGENREDDTPKPVTTTDDVGTFVSKNIRQLFDQAGVKTVDSNADVIITGEVKKFFVREESTYKSTVEIHLTVIDQAGKTLWNGIASGDATRFGRSYKAENYYEVLSDAVVNTVSSMLLAADFEKALSAGSVVHAGADPPH
jgi:hypothetical protein